MRRRSGTRTLAAVLFTDIVDSSAIAGRIGDARWREVIARHHAIVRSALKRYGGRELDTAGDGFFAAFAEPAAAVRCACVCSGSVRQLGIEIRAGVHFGECEQVGGKLAGVTVVVGSRVTSLGGPGEVLVTGTVRELVGGGGFGFEDRGVHPLKGVDGEWHVFGVSSVDGTVRQGPADELVAERRLEGIQPGRARSRAWVAGAGFVAAAAIVAALVALRPSEGPSGLARIASDRVGWIDPETGAIEGELDVGSNPTGVAVRGGIAWIARLDAGNLARVDLSTEEVESLSTGGHPVALSVDEGGSVWILNGFEATVVRVDPRRMVVDQTIELSTGTKDLTAGLGAVWITNGNKGTLTRIDLVTKVVDAVKLEGIGTPDGVATSDDAVWVAGSAGVVKLDPRSLEETGSWPLRFPAGEIVAGEGAVWVAHLTDDSVTKVDEATGPSSVIEVGNGPVELTVGGGAVWVTDSLDGTVSRIDPQTGTVTAIRVGGSPEGVAFGGGSLWITVHGT
jgi:YVTN family beta-propeller protein